MRFLAIGFGRDPVLAEGDMSDPGDCAALAEVFAEQLEAGRYAVLPAGLDLCCRRGSVVDDFSEIPTGATEISFLTRESQA